MGMSSGSLCSRGYGYGGHDRVHCFEEYVAVSWVGGSVCLSFRYVYTVREGLVATMWTWMAPLLLSSVAPVSRSDFDTLGPGCWYVESIWGYNTRI